MKPSPISEIHNFRQVDAKLFTSGQPAESHFDALAKEGIEAVINLALHDDPRYSLPDEAGLAGSLSMEYVHIPVQFNAPAEADLLKFFYAMHKHQHQKVLVHCAANKRATAFLGLYYAITQDRDEADAFALMKQVWQPDPVWSSFISTMLGKHKALKPQRLP